MSLTRAEFNARVKRWQQCEPGDLAKNFHRLGGNFDATTESTPDFQFELANHFTINEFEKLKEKAARITKIKIWMSMQNFVKTQIGFEPILEVFFKNDPGDVTEETFLLSADANGLIPLDTQQVPIPFVHNTTKLWSEVESENIPSMFEVRGINGLPQRVQFYTVDGPGLDRMKIFMASMSGMSILPGLDLNKTVDSGETIFIPIIKINAPVNQLDFASFTEHDHHGIFWSLQDGDDDNFFDYGRPCPPFCGNN